MKVIATNRQSAKKLKSRKYQKYRPKTSNTKSLSVCKWNSQDEPKNTNSDNEYGLIDQGRNLQMLKSFDINDNMITPIREELGELSKDEIQYNLEMLMKYVHNGKDQKVISTLQLLLDHYMTKENNQKHFKRHSLDAIYSPSSKARIETEINSPLINDSLYFTTPDQPESSYLVTSQSNFDENRRRNSEEPSQKFYFNNTSEIKNLNFDSVHSTKREAVSKSSKKKNFDSNKKYKTKSINEPKSKPSRILK